MVFKYDSNYQIRDRLFFLIKALLMLRTYPNWGHQVIDELSVLKCLTYKSLKECVGKGWTGSLVVLPSPAVGLLFLCDHFEKKHLILILRVLDGFCSICLDRSLNVQRKIQDGLSDSVSFSRAMKIQKGVSRTFKSCLLLSWAILESI